MDRSPEDRRPAQASTTAAKRAFLAPRTRFEIDVDGILAAVPDGIKTKGMFFNRCLAVVREHIGEDELLRNAGLEVQRFIPFGDYPWTDYFRLNLAAADVLCSGRTAIGVRTIGREIYTEFADSLAGRLTFGVLRTNADRVIGLGPKGWNMSGAPGKLVGESIGDRHYHYHFNGYPADMAETLAVGILESALHSCGEVGQLTIARLDSMNSIVDIRWG